MPPAEYSHSQLSALAAKQIDVGQRDVRSEEARDSKETQCCVVGGGPAGIVLGLLLARQGVDVTVLEAHRDFDRDFRGDTIHPSTLELMNQLGLAERLLQMPHGEVRTIQFITREETFQLVKFERLKTKFPFIMTLPQALFLEFLAQEAKKYPTFHLLLGANVQQLVTVNDCTVGVRYRDVESQWHEIRAPLTVAADGRFSKVRLLAGLEPIKTAPPMDVLWFRLPRKPADAPDAGFYVGGGHLVIVLNRGDQWQIAYAILKGGYQQVRAQGIEALQKALVERVPWLADRARSLEDWKQVSVLSVESSRLPFWYRPGLLLIGDAAHVMSPVGGVGINYAIQDAVVTSNLLGDSLKQGKVSMEQLAAVQKRRELPVKFIQKVQGYIQQRVVAAALQGDNPFRIPLPMRVIVRLPILRNFPARLVGFGIRKVRIKTELAPAL